MAAMKIAACLLVLVLLQVSHGFASANGDAASLPRLMMGSRRLSQSVVIDPLTGEPVTASSSDSSDPTATTTNPATTASSDSSVVTIPTASAVTPPATAAATGNTTATNTTTSATYTYPLVSDTCKVADINFAGYNASDAAAALTNFTGGLPASCAPTAAQLSACAAELAIAQGCCSTACAAYFTTLSTSPCTSAITSAVCGAGTSSAYVVNFIQAMNRCTGKSITCPVDDNTYPLVVPTGVVCPIKQTASNFTITNLVVNQMKQAILGKVTDACNSDGVDAFSTCISDLNNADGCCSAKCASALAQGSSDLCVPLWTTAVCGVSNGTAVASELLMTIQRCVPGYANFTLICPNSLNMTVTPSTGNTTSTTSTSNVTGVTLRVAAKNGGVAAVALPSMLLLTAVLAVLMSHLL